MNTKKNQKKQPLKGVISISSKGTGYVALEGFPEDPEIDHNHLNTALHGDTVELILHPKGKDRLKGEVCKIVQRAKSSFAGILEKESGLFFCKPDDSKMYTDILIPKNLLHGSIPGQKVFVEITSWKDPRKAPEGKVVKILGKAGENNAEMHAIAMEKGFDNKLPDKILSEAQKIKERGIKEEDYKGRKDFRKTLTFTIDPADAKDFDDAISFKELNNEEYEVGIHIADVTNYVKEGSALDNEAYKRATSVYLVDRTIPMLPEILSNDLCSLVPNQDRLTMSAVFTIDKNAKVKSEWYGKSVICSQKRFSYEEAEKSIHNTNAPLHNELSILNGIAKKLTKDRFASGAISLEQVEVKFVLDSKGKPIKVIQKIRGDSNKLIEEFMLLANRKVAEFLSNGIKSKNGISDGILIYRIHDIPRKEKTDDLVSFLESLGHKIYLKDGVIPADEINNILKKLAGKSEEDTVHRAVIRSMEKAIYSTKNVGHYGLAFKYYTHFTSPIRRYPDMIIHRLLTLQLENKKIPKNKFHEYQEIAIKASEQEKKASDAERASIKYKQVEYMSERVGQSFVGVISGITEWGIYVEEKETKSEGMVRMRDLDDDFYIFNEKRMEIVGEKKKKKYRLGDQVKIKVKGIDLVKKTIDYVLS